MFTWSGTDRMGKRIRGEVRGEDMNRIRAQLVQKGVVRPKVRRKTQLFSAREKKITSKDITVFSRQLATMLTSGVPMVTAFDIVGKGHDNPSMAKLILAVKNDIEGGTQLADALSRHPKYFSGLYVNLVSAGETAGILDHLLAKLATYLEKTESLKARVRKALFYPAAVLVVAFAVTVILLVFVVPQFESLFRSFGGDLPAMTRMVVQLSEFFQAQWWKMALGIGGLVGGLAVLRKRSTGFGHFIDRMALRLPLIGAIVNKGTVARFARTLSTMFAAGVPLVEALESVARASGNVVYEQAILHMREQVATGMTLQQSMDNTGLFANMEMQMVAIGEESGALDNMLAKVADFYEEEVDNLVDSLTSLIEPMIMAFLGVVIGGLVIAMYLPIFKMAAVI